MTTQEQDTNQEYLKGFNNGYLMAKHEPELSEQISKIENASLQVEGFKAGRKEYFKDLLKGRIQDWVKDIPPHARDISPERDRGFEPEK